MKWGHIYYNEKGLKHTENISLWSDKEIVRNISKSKFVSIAEAIGIAKEDIPTKGKEEFYNKPFGIKIKHTKKEDKTYINISKIFKAEDVKSDIPGWK